MAGNDNLVRQKFSVRITKDWGNFSRCKSCTMFMDMPIHTCQKIVYFKQHKILFAFKNTLA